MGKKSITYKKGNETKYVDLQDVAGSTLVQGDIVPLSNATIDATQLVSGKDVKGLEGDVNKIVTTAQNNSSNIATLDSKTTKMLAIGTNGDLARLQHGKYGPGDKGALFYSIDSHTLFAWNGSAWIQAMTEFVIDGYKPGVETKN